MFKKCYYVFMEAINFQLQGNVYEFWFLGIDELLLWYNFLLLEVCNISFQVYLQVSFNNFVLLYNILQVLVVFVIVVFVNLFIVFGKCLWYESCIVLF